MKMPKMTAEQSTGTPINFYGGSAINGGLQSDSLQMAGIFDDIWGGIKDIGRTITGKIPCLTACGINALPCIKCGTNLGCWAQCAGPEAISCVSDCLG